MTVYVDDLHRYQTRGFTTWCHCWADSEAELLAMADVIGLKHDWIQRQPIHAPVDPHFDLSASKRELALAHGAVYMKVADFLREYKAREGQP